MNKDKLSFKKFGLQLSIGLLVPSILVSISKQTLWLWTVPLSLIVFFISIYIPQKLEIIYSGIETIGKVLSIIFAFISFYFIITPFSWILRLSKVYQTPIFPDSKQKSYWEQPDDSETNKIDFRRQF